MSGTHRLLRLAIESEYSGKVAKKRPRHLSSVECHGTFSAHKFLRGAPLLLDDRSNTLLFFRFQIGVHGQTEDPPGITLAHGKISLPIAQALEGRLKV